LADPPESAFWRYSLALYDRPSVAAACLALQDRLAADVNLVLLGLWLGARGQRLGAADGARLAAIAVGWQDPIVAPLRLVRRRLKASDDLPWRRSVAEARRQLGQVELAMERIEQLLLEHGVGAIAQRPPDADAGRANLAALGLGRLLETAELAELMDAAFGPGAPAS
jgi:uncharacterized protein (TIGR02444 family)